MVETQNILSNTSIILGICILAFGIIMFKWKSNKDKKKALNSKKIDGQQVESAEIKDVKVEKIEESKTEASTKPEDQEKK